MANSVKRGSANRNFGKGKWYIGYQVGISRRGFFKENICIYYGRNDHTVGVYYRKYGYPPGWRTTIGNSYANNVGSNVQVFCVEMKMKGDGWSMTFTKDQFNGLTALLERNNVDGIKHATNIIRGESISCYSAGVAGKHSNHNDSLLHKAFFIIVGKWVPSQLTNRCKVECSYEYAIFHHGCVIVVIN